MAPVAGLNIEMRAGFDKLGADLKKINRGFKSLEKDVTGSFSKIGTVINVAIGAAAIAGVVKLGKALGGLAERGEKFGSISQSFEKLGGKSSTIEAARTRIIGLASSFDLMATANKGLVAGIPNFEKSFANIVDLGGRLANTFGQDTTQAVNDLTDAIVKGQAKALIPLGFSFTDTSDKAKVTQEALAQLEKVMGRFDKVGDSAANAFTSLSISLSDAWTNLAIGVNSSEELTKNFRDLELSIKGLDLQNFGKDLGDVIGMLAQLAGSVLPPLVKLLREAAEGWRYLLGKENVADKINQTQAKIDDLTDSIAHLKNKQYSQMPVENWLFGTTQEQIDKLQKEMDELIAKRDALLKDQNRAPTDLGTIGPGNKSKTGSWLRIDVDKQGIEDAAKKASKDLKDAAKAIREAAYAYDGIADSIGAAASKLGLDGGQLSQGLSGLFTDEEKKGFLDQISGMLGVSAEEFSSYAKGAMTALGSIFEAGAINKKTHSEAGTGGALGSTIGAIFGKEAGAQIGNVVGTYIGGMFKWGASNPQTLARKAFEQFLEDAFKDLSVRFFGKNGKLGGVFNGNFIGKALTQDFNGDWTKNMNAWGDKATGTFLGLGEAMKELQGITEDVGAQIGYMLGTNLAGNIDNAKILVMELGLSFEQVSEALLKSALKGSISWSEFNRYIAETSEAFKPGLAAVGAIGDAFQNLIDGAGQGRISVKSFKDVAVEAMEAGVNSMDALKQRLLAGGADPEYVNALFSAAAQRGIKSLEEWASASDTVAGSVVGDMESLSAKLQDTWKGMRESLKEMSDALKEIPSKVNSKVTIDVTTKYDDKTQAVIDTFGSGVSPSGVPAPTSRSLNSTVSNSVSNGSATSANATRQAATSGGNSIHIDARGAAPGVEQQIMRAAAYVEQNVMRQVYSTLSNGRQRGGRAGDTY